jgi:hypothetical protein
MEAEGSLPRSEKSPLDPIRSQTNTVHTLFIIKNPFKHHSAIYACLPSLFSHSGLPTKIVLEFLISPCLTHFSRITFNFDLKSANYEAPRYAISSDLLFVSLE